jgi:anti-sigma regulatory factor (Ser/Thr protein kinase)
MESSLQKLPGEDWPQLSVQPTTPATIAIYEAPNSPPKLEEIAASDPVKFISSVATRIYQVISERNSAIPFTAIKEVVENLIHACFTGVVVTILEKGNTIRVSDRGPGIANKKLAFEAGFTTATPNLRRFIRAVGSGLFIARRAMNECGGTIQLQDNLSRGTVVTLSAPPAKPPETTCSSAQETSQAQLPKLTDRQKKVLFIVTEYGSVGPTRVSEELRTSLSTAYRDLATLEKARLVQTNKQGQRSLTAYGVSQLELILRT